MLDDVGCTGTETRLIECPATLNHNCAHSEDAGVRCTSSTTGTNGTKVKCCGVIFAAVHGQVV